MENEWQVVIPLNMGLVCLLLTLNHDLSVDNRKSVCKKTQAMKKDAESRFFLKWTGVGKIDVVIIVVASHCFNLPGVV